MIESKRKKVNTGVASLDNSHRIYEDLITDLTYLRKENGFTAGRLRNASTLLAVLGGRHQDFNDLKTRFVSAINSLPDKHSVDILLSAYGLADIYSGIRQLSARRKVYGLTAGLKTDAVAKHENAAIEELAVQLLSADYTMSPLPFSSRVMPHNACLHEYIEINTIVENKLWKETKELYKIVFLVSNVGWLDISSDIPAIVTSTCDVRAETEPSSNGLRHRFHFDRLKMRGQATTLSFTMTPDTTLANLNDLILIEETRAFHEPTVKSKFAVTFIGQTPKTIWQYDHLAYFDRPGQPSKQQLLTLNSHNTAEANFTDLYGGMYSGVAWKW